ncbi:MAG: alkaline phosphatase [Methylacidiphilales bacterium]|nr:alkaline phosphatase [Candidatus Methylacidiphilales bacterium]MDW8349492.1 alkaline phosphatase [Verrucomicrobiae bacterium]
MKTSVRFLLVALVFAIFVAIGSLYMRFYVAPKTHGIILFIANGYDISLINRARLQAAKKGQSLHMDRLHQVALLTTRGLNENVADDAASATALASGELSPNSIVGYNSLGRRLDTLIYAAQRAGRLTGLVTTNELTANTPTAFYSTKSKDPESAYQAAAELIDTSNIDIILGGGKAYFTPASVKNPYGRLDRRDLISEADKRGYEIVMTRKALEAIPRWPQRRVFGLFADHAFIYSSLTQGTMDQPSLADLTRRAIELMDLHLGGYFLVIDHGLIENASRRNLTQLALNEIAALDEAIRVAIAYAGRKSLILCTSNFSLGSLDVRRSQLIESTPPTEDITYDWLSGPGGKLSSPHPSSPATTLQDLYLRIQSPNDLALLTPQPAIHYSDEAEITSRPSWIASRGFGEDYFRGFLDATEIYNLIVRLY